MIRLDLLLEESQRWLTGFLCIAQEHSLHELVLGRRFFTLLVVPDKKSSLIGQRLPDGFGGEPYPHWDEHSFKI